MKLKHLKILAMIFAVFLVLAVPVMGLADAGNFGGDSDWGDSDWGDSDWGGSDWDDDDDWGDSTGGGIFFSGGGGGGFGGFISIIGMAIIVLIVVSVLNGMRRGGANVFTTQRAGQGHPYTGGGGGSTNLDKLKEQDPDFSEEEFTEKVGNIYVQMQNAWEAKKWEPLRAVMTDAMFNQFDRQLQEYIDNKQTNHIDRIAVMGANIAGYRQDDVNDILTVRLRTRIVDYVTDDATGELIRGSKSKELFMEYEYTFIRRKGVKTEVKEDVSTVNCPNCGAPLSLNHSGQCEYCHSVVTSGDYDWVISNIKGISQRSK